jgi:hypothetical protein
MEMLKPKMAFNTFFGEFETPNLHIEGMVKWLLGNFNANFELLDSGSSPLISHHNRECRLPEFRKNEFRLSYTSSSNPVNGFEKLFDVTGLLKNQVFIFFFFAAGKRILLRMSR